jgi:hypothetical protein
MPGRLRRDATFVCLETIVLERGVENAFAGLLLAVSLPLLAFHSILAKLNVVARALLRRMGRRPEPRDGQFAPPFGFDRAIEAYEELIDATLAKRRI